MPDTSLKARYTSVLSADDRAVLRASWQAEPVIWCYETAQIKGASLANWLGQQGPADWHDIILGFNWEAADYSLPQWIAGQANADRATIMTMILAIDLGRLEAERLNDSGLDPHSFAPEASHLMDIICRGFAKSYYRQSAYALGFSRSVLTQTKRQIANLGQSPQWPLPDEAWTLPSGHAHDAALCWDTARQGQRIPFESWLQLKVRPH